ncbi:hypothetical protein TRVL_06250 [Trypanosoma vivax]|nr:hypothetical protein TRVL_06250 [Trypanosoma vivax]
MSCANRCHTSVLSSPVVLHRRHVRLLACSTRANLQCFPVYLHAPCGNRIALLTLLPTNSYLQHVSSYCRRFGEFLLFLDGRCPLTNCCLHFSTRLPRHLRPSAKLPRLVHCARALPFLPAALL